ncbi:MAG TPA: hypothetical protein VFU07_05570 [Candidatus Lumbricidophila sp.]|nr:hypothetical protein [Candidatus Lumbricidophila sp.]
MSETQDNQIPTAAFFADPRASTFLLKDTVRSLLATYKIQHAYVDLTTLPGMTVATVLLESGIAYEAVNFGQQRPEALPLSPTNTDKRFKPSKPRTMQDLPYLEHMSAGEHVIDIAKLADINANLVLIPGQLGAPQHLIDFSQNTLVGAVLTQAEALKRDVLVVVPPERGLRAIVPSIMTEQHNDVTVVSPEQYERQVVLVRAAE